MAIFAHEIYVIIFLALIQPRLKYLYGRLHSSCCQNRSSNKINDIWL